jgi:hypothetical protein
MENTKTEIIPFNQLPQSIKDEVDQNLAYFSTALLGIEDSYGAKENVRFTASGTFIEIDGQAYILTAGHVISNLKKCKCNALGLNISRNTHAFRLEVQLLRMTYLWNENEEKIGPDIGLILLPNECLGWLRALKSFWKIDLYSEESIKRKYDDTFIWAICGAPFEKNIYKDHSRNYKTVITQHMGPWLANEVKRYDSGDFDKIDVLFKGVPDPTWPKDFKGLSGGGLWHIILFKDPESPNITLKYLILSGTAFYQDTIDEETAFIRCHAENSIYVKIRDLLSKL